MNGSGDIHSIGLLPDKLKTELALHVNLETLRKVLDWFIKCFFSFLDLIVCNWNRWPYFKNASQNFSTIWCLRCELTYSHRAMWFVARAK